MKIAYPEWEQTMGIAQKVSRNFSDAVRARGQSYFVKGRVTLMASRPGEVVARVRGTAKYRVRVRLRGSKLLASCTCPYFSPQGEPCKHLWATLLLADSRNLIQAPPVFPLRLVVEAPRRPAGTAGLPIRDDSGTGHPPYPFQPELGLLGLEPAPPGSAGIGPAPRGTRPRTRDRGTHGEPMGEPGTWGHRGHSPRDRRAKLKSPGIVPGQGAAAGAGRAKAVNRNGKRLLVYVLDVAATLAQNQVVIDLARRQRKTTGEWGPLRPGTTRPGPRT